MRLSPSPRLHNVHRDFLHWHHPVLPDPARPLRGAVHPDRRDAPVHRPQDLQWRNGQEPGPAPGQWQEAGDAAQMKYFILLLVASYYVQLL